MTRHLRTLVSTALILGMASSVYAEENVNINVVTSEMTNKSAEATVEAEISSTYSVTIPKLIKLTDTNTTTYEVSASGDIAGYERIHVEPESSIILSQVGKPDITATIEQPIVNFHSNDWTEELGTTDGLVSSTYSDNVNNPVNAVGTIKINKLTAGSWSGKLVFNVERIGYTDFTLTRDNMYMTGILSDEIIENNYTKDENGNWVCNLTGSDAMQGLSGDIIVPDVFVYNGEYYRTVGLSGRAFYNDKYITSITIPDGVTYIGNEAIRDCSRIKSIVLPDSVTAIGDLAFAFTPLTSVNIPDGVTYIGLGAFMATELKSIELPDALIYMTGTSFPSSLSSIYIPLSVKTIVADTREQSPYATSTFKIYCGASEAQQGWGTYWNYNRVTKEYIDTVYGYTREQYEAEIAELD